MQKPSQQCIRDLQAQPGGVIAFGGELKWDADHNCDDGQIGKYQTAAWDAHALATMVNTEPDEHNAREVALWKTWIGPDFPTQQKRIAENFKRASEFPTKKEFDIILSCNDKKGTCGVKKDGKSVGGYAFTYNGWFGYKYYYIVMCLPFWQSDDLMYKTDQIEEELSKGNIEKATQAVWQKSSGQTFLHEMMHLDSVGQPHINDEYVNPEAGSKWADGPSLVHKLARLNLNQGGGATRASTNADSYAWLANSKYWYDLTGYFPQPPNWKNMEATDSYSQDDWEKEHNGFTLNFGEITETTTDEELQDRLNSIVTGFNSTGSSSRPGSGKALSIVMITQVNSHSRGASIDNTWHFYTTKVGHAVECRENTDLVQELTSQGPSNPSLSSKVKSEDLPWPAGIYRLNIEGEDCDYKCDGTNPGRLFCPKKEISCKEDSKKIQSDGMTTCGSSRVTFHAVVYCDF